MPLRVGKMVHQFGRWRADGRPRPPSAFTPTQQTRSRQAVIDALPSSVALLGADGVILLVNQTWRRYSGATLCGPDVDVGVNYLRACRRAAAAAGAAAGIRRVLARSAPVFKLEYPCHTAGGERWFELIATPLTDPPLVGVVVSHCDVSLRKQAERKLLSGALCLADANVGSWEFDLATMRATLSDEMYRLSYCRAGTRSLDSATFLSLAHPYDRAALARALVPAADAAPQTALEYRTNPTLGPERLISAVVHPVRAADGRVVRTTGMARDVSERPRCQLLSARMAAIVESSEDAIISKNMAGRIISWNPGAERIFGYSAGDMLGQPILRLIPLEHHAQEAAILRRLRAGKRIEPYVTTRVTQSGRVIDVSLSITPIKDEHGNVVGASKVLRDISEQRQIHLKLKCDAERLQRLSHRLMTTEEEERRRLGRDLHDQTGSNLTAITLNLQVLRSKLPSALAAELKQRIDDIEALLRETIVHIRDVLSNLRPPALDEFGLLAALRYYAQRLGTGSDLRLDITGEEPSPRLPPEVEIALFRMAQEGLTNVLKHARARSATIGLIHSGKRVRFLIQDDGCGFDSRNSLSALGSLGMTTMQERAQAIGATLRLRSAIGVGTQISVEVEHGAAATPAAAAAPGAP